MTEEIESKKFENMLNEVQEIVTNISEDRCDLDTLVTNVERGFELIKQMRSRLEETREKIETLRTEFDHEAPVGP